MNKRSKKVNNLDLIAAIVIAAIGLYSSVSGILMMFDITGAEKWYYSPGFFPLFLGVILIILGIVLFVSKSKNGRIDFTTLLESNNVEKKQELIKLLIAIVLFAINVFVLFGRLPFIVSTCIYLFVTMSVFRENNFAIWKIIVISICFSVFLYFFFVVVAKVPLS